MGNSLTFIYERFTQGFSFIKYFENSSKGKKSEFYYKKILYQPFAFPNGIHKEERLKKIIELCGNNHLKAKEKLQKIYFKFEKLDETVVLFSFVGRITTQKGVINH